MTRSRGFSYELMEELTPGLVTTEVVSRTTALCKNSAWTQHAASLSLDSPPPPGPSLATPSQLPSSSVKGGGHAGTFLVRRHCSAESGATTSPVGFQHICCCFSSTCYFFFLCIILYCIEFLEGVWTETPELNPPCLTRSPPKSVLPFWPCHALS